MIHKNDTAYKIFKKYGFSWGGYNMYWFKDLHN